MAQDKEDEAKLIDCPTLVLWGEDFAFGGKMWDFREVWLLIPFRNAATCHEETRRLLIASCLPSSGLNTATLSRLRYEDVPGDNPRLCS